MPYVSYQLDKASGLPVISPLEEVDITNASGLHAVLGTTAECGHATIVVDMTRTRFCDPTALSVLVLAHKQAVAEGGELRLVIPSAAVLRVPAVTGIDRLISSFARLDKGPDRAGHRHGRTQPPGVTDQLLNTADSNIAPPGPSNAWAEKSGTR